MLQTAYENWILVEEEHKTFDKLFIYADADRNNFLTATECSDLVKNPNIMRSYLLRLNWNNNLHDIPNKILAIAEIIRKKYNFAVTKRQFRLLMWQHFAETPELQEGYDRPHFH